MAHHGKREGRGVRHCRPFRRRPPKRRAWEGLRPATKPGRLPGREAIRSRFRTDHPPYLLQTQSVPNPSLGLLCLARLKSRPSPSFGHYGASSSEKPVAPAETHLSPPTSLRAMSPPSNGGASSECCRSLQISVNIAGNNLRVHWPRSSNEEIAPRSYAVVKSSAANGTTSWTR